MQSDKEFLDFDLNFLNEPKSREAQTQAASTYKVNWHNIATLVGVAVAIVFFIWIVSSENTSGRRSPTTSNAPAPTGPWQEYQPQASNIATAVNDGEFSCSRYDSNQADLMRPKNDSELTQEQKELERRGGALDSLRAQIDSGRFVPSSDQASIDRNNTMISRYNVQLTSYQADYSSLQRRIDIYNQLVQARNNYLITHCTRTR